MMMVEGQQGNKTRRAGRRTPSRKEGEREIEKESDIQNKNKKCENPKSPNKECERCEMQELGKREEWLCVRERERERVQEEWVWEQETKRELITFHFLKPKELRTKSISPTKTVSSDTPTTVWISPPPCCSDCRDCIDRLSRLKECFFIRNFFWYFIQKCAAFAFFVALTLCACSLQPHADPLSKRQPPMMMMMMIMQSTDTLGVWHLLTEHLVSHTHTGEKGERSRTSSVNPLVFFSWMQPYHTTTHLPRRRSSF